MYTMKKFNQVWLAAGLAASMALCGTAQAQMRIEISGVGSNQIPVAVAGFADEGIARNRFPPSSRLTSSAAAPSS
jgi:TolB protein